MTTLSKQAKLADRLLRQGHLEPAIEACDLALHSDPGDLLARVVLAEALLRAGFHDPAIDAAASAIETDPSCAPAYLTLGLAYDRRGGMWDRSVLVWQELAEVMPDLVLAQVHLGESLDAAGLADEAIDAWRGAVAADPKEPRAMYHLAIAALEKDGLATALPGLKRAGEMDPSQDAFFFQLAGFDPTTMSEPVAGDDSSREARLRGALVSGFAEDYFESADLIRLILAEQPDDAQALALAGYLYLKQEAVNEAMAVSLRALAVSAKTPSAVYVLGAAFSRRPGLAENSSRVFDALAKAAPEAAMSHVLLAESLMSLQRYSAALNEYRRAVDLDPTLVRARFGLGAALLVEGEYSAGRMQVAEGVYHDVAKRNPFSDLFRRYAEGEATDAQ